MSSQHRTKEPANPFNFLLLLSGCIFTMTALAVAVVPVLEDLARKAGNPPPYSAFREALRTQGMYWLLYQLAAVILFGLASMVLDRLRRLQKDRESARIRESSEPTTTEPLDANHVHNETSC